MFKRILIANRGEIALRVIRTAREMGIECVAVFSEADRCALHTRMAHVAVPLGGRSPAESYLSIDKILAAAKGTGAQAIHPGYGFLAENAEFARRCTDAGVIFIGVGIAAVATLLRVPVLPFAVGVYLPLGLSVPIFIGGLIAHFVAKKSATVSTETKQARENAGLLIALGLITGEALMGVVTSIAATVVFRLGGAMPVLLPGSLAGFLGVAALVFFIVYQYRRTLAAD